MISIDLQARRMEWNGNPRRDWPNPRNYNYYIKLALEDGRKNLFHQTHI